MPVNKTCLLRTERKKTKAKFGLYCNSVCVFRFMDASGTAQSMFCRSHCGSERHTYSTSSYFSRTLCIDLQFR